MVQKLYQQISFFDFSVGRGGGEEIFNGLNGLDAMFDHLRWGVYMLKTSTPYEKF